MSYIPVIDWSISVGNLLTILSMAVISIGVIWGMRSDIRAISQDIKYIQEKQQTLNEAFTQLGNILTKVAVQDTRLAMIEKNIDELRHGDGFVRKAKDR